MGVGGLKYADEDVNMMDTYLSSILAAPLESVLCLVFLPLPVLSASLQAEVLNAS